jgi:hypothetical protein
MNFLRPRRLAPWVLCLAAVGCGSGADPSNDPVDASAPADVGAFAADSPAAAADVAARPLPCSANGSGRLRVSLGLDPGLAMRNPEVWLLVRCGQGAGSERVLRWDRSATQTIDALGPGSYEVIGSSFLAPWSSSTRAMLADGATAAVTLTLPPTPPALAQLRSAALPHGAPPVWRGSTPLISGTTAASVATLEVEAAPYVGSPPAATDREFVSVSAVVRNPCASGQCAPYVLRALEIRTRAGDAPTGLLGFAFPDGERLEPGESKSVPQALVVRGAMPDDAHGLELVLYGEVVRPENARP